MRIITISREFGSGGRELGKRMADILEFDYYDKEIISRMGGEIGDSGINSTYINNVLSNHGWSNVPITFRNSFSSAAYQSATTSLISLERQVIDRIAENGQDCIIVGRNADAYLKQYSPFNIFVCADIAARIARCREYGEDVKGSSDREIEKQIKRIDKSRADLHDLASEAAWGARGSYHLIVNSTGWTIKALALAVAEFAEHWFAR